MYLFMRFLQAAKQSFQEIDEQGRVKIPIRIVGSPGATKNFVHIDYVVKMMKTILTHPETHGKTFHITHSNPPTLSSIQTVIEDLLGVTGTRLVDEESFLKQPPTELEDLLSQQLSFYAPYLLKEPVFDNGSIKSSLPQSGRPECPPMDHEALEKLFSYAIDSKWGRKMIL
jgi:nucleoside-diphosphate-sugar epimerase